MHANYEIEWELLYWWNHAYNFDNALETIPKQEKPRKIPTPPPIEETIAVKSYKRLSFEMVASALDNEKRTL